MAEYWASDPDRLLMPTAAMDGDTRTQARQVRMADNQRNRAYRAGASGRAWEAGDPGRKDRETGQCKPWRSFCREQYDWGAEDRRTWLVERDHTRRMDELAKQARAVLREQRKADKARVARRKRRADHAYRIVRPLAPVWARRLRRLMT